MEEYLQNLIIEEDTFFSSIEYVNRFTKWLLNGKLCKLFADKINRYVMYILGSTF